MMIRTFKAASFQEACEQVQSMMGPNAFILKREKKRVPGILGWLLKRYEWEIVAAKMARPGARGSDINTAVDSSVPLMKRRKSEQSGAFRIPQRRSSLGTSRNRMSRSQSNDIMRSTGPVPMDANSSRSPEAPAGSKNKVNPDSPLARAFAAEEMKAAPKRTPENHFATEGPRTEPVLPSVPESPFLLDTDAKASVLSSAGEPTSQPVPSAGELTSQPVPSAGELTSQSDIPLQEENSSELREIKTQMESMQSMFKQFMEAQQEKDRRLQDLEEKLSVKGSSRDLACVGLSEEESKERVDALVQAAAGAAASRGPVVTAGYSGTPEAVRNMINMLRHAEFEAPLIASVRGHLFEVMDEKALASESAVKNCVAEYIANGISTTGGLNLKRGEKHCVALVGPTGVGKTTTLAKLAAGLKFNLGLKVGFITIDTYRVAACDQLEKYGEIIDVPVHIAFDPKQLKEGLELFADKDVILIDTVGRNGKNASEIAEIGKFLECGVDIETHLVLSACSKFSEMKKDLKNFQPLNYGQVIFSKTDESSTLGTILSLVSEAGKSVSYVTTGQNVPDDISIADSQKLALQAIGLEKDAAPVLELEEQAPSLAAVIDHEAKEQQSEGTVLDFPEQAE